MTHGHTVPYALATGGPLADAAVAAAMDGCPRCQSIAIAELALGAHVLQVAALVSSYAASGSAAVGAVMGKRGKEAFDTWSAATGPIVGRETKQVLEDLRLVAEVPGMSAIDTSAAIGHLEKMGAAGRAQVCNDALEGLVGVAHLIGS